MERADILFPLRHREMGCKQKHGAWEKLLRQGRLEESIPSHPPLTGKKMGLSWAAWGTMEVPRWSEKRFGMCGMQSVTHVHQAGYLPTQPETPRKESNLEKEKKKKKAREE